MEFPELMPPKLLRRLPRQALPVLVLLPSAQQVPLGQQVLEPWPLGSLREH